jgi:ubiquitin carboxyl-terminal hydrolase L5
VFNYQLVYFHRLDGLKSGPVRLGTVANSGGGGGWLSVAVPIIAERMKQCSDAAGPSGEQTFNLLRITKCPLLLLSELNNDSTSPSAADYSQHISNLLEEYKHRLDQQRVENTRRQHNYIPFIIQLMRECAGKL